MNTIQWIINAAQVKKLIIEGATILDTRNQIIYFLSHIPGAIHVTWQQFSQTQSPHKGKLLNEDNILQEKLRQIGIYNSKPIIVVSNSGHNFGEEGRIVWMLHTLGHTQAAFVDGGHNALVQAGIPMTLKLTQPPRGDFIVNRTTKWEITRDELQAKLAENQLIVIDTRERREFAGGTPYGEQRRGHIPGAVHFYFKDLMDSHGKLQHPTQIIAKLEQLGIQYNTPIVAYCTGGIRSGFFVAVLVSLGFTNVKNYAGSMWEWSALPSENYQLEF